jgi:hypothetical protein
VIGRDIGEEIQLHNISIDLRLHLIALVNDFQNREIVCSVRDREYTYAVAAFCELERLFTALVTIYPEFETNLKVISAGLDKLHRTNRSMLLKDYLKSRDPAEIDSIAETLSAEIHADRSWDWEREYDQAIEKGGHLSDVRAFA